MSAVASRKVDAVIFDLDGTLVDSIERITEGTNYSLRNLKRAEVTAEHLATFIGKGVIHLFRSVLGEDAAESVINRAVELKKEFELTHHESKIKTFDGVGDLVRTLKKAGLKLAVLSNKDEEVVKNAVNRSKDLEGMFEIVAGARDDKPLKPDATVPKELAKSLGVAEERCAYIGDTDVDMMTGKNAGMYTIGVTWGFRTEEELRSLEPDGIVYRANDIANLLLHQ